MAFRPLLIAGLALLAVAVAFTGWAWVQIPDTALIATHWNSRTVTSTAHAQGAGAADRARDDGGTAASFWGHHENRAAPQQSRALADVFCGGLFGSARSLRRWRTGPCGADGARCPHAGDGRPCSRLWPRSSSSSAISWARPAPISSPACARRGRSKAIIPGKRPIAGPGAFCLFRHRHARGRSDRLVEDRCHRRPHTARWWRVLSSAWRCPTSSGRKTRTATRTIPCRNEALLSRPASCPGSSPARPCRRSAISRRSAAADRCRCPSHVSRVRRA